LQNLIGSRIDSYRVEALLGEGGMGAVYRAHDLNLDRPVALKVMHDHLARNPEFRQRFMQEARSAARLSHPSIVDIYQFGSSKELLFIVMAFVPGTSLARYIRGLQQSGQSVQLRETLAILAQVAEALGYAHHQGVVHRDVKPDNVLLRTLDQPDREGDPPLRAVLTDFGLAKLLEGGVSTQTGTFMGTLPYMSPEQVLGKKDIDGRSDLYSLGVMLYQLTTGQLPFDIQSPTDAVMKHLNEVPPAPSDLRPGLPPRVEVIIKKALAKKPEDRIQTGREMARALRYVATQLTEADVTRFAPPDSVVSLVTQLQMEKAAEKPSQLGSGFAPLAASDQLIIAHHGEDARAVPLDKSSIVVGRAETCDLPLAAPGISRQHARLEKTDSGWQVTDLGSTNGTFLAESKLLPDIPEPWDSGQVFRIGPYYLHWQPAAPGGSDMGDAERMVGPAIGIAATASTAPPGATQMMSSSGRLSIVVNPTVLEIGPGSTGTVQVDLQNQGHTVDHFKIEAIGLPSEWVIIQQDTVQLMPGGTASLPVLIKPPRDSSATAGRHRFRIMVRSVANPAETATVSGTLEMESFAQLAIDMRPKQLKHGSVCRVLLHNEGNADQVYAIVGRDPAEAVQFVGQTSRLQVAPGARQAVDLKVKARSRPLFGRSKTLPFQIQISEAGGGKNGEDHTIGGALEVPPVFPSWMLPLFVALLLFLCLASALALGLPDSDGDGLRNYRELLVGTSLNDPDTDKDGIADGQDPDPKIAFVLTETPTITPTPASLPTESATPSLTGTPEPTATGTLSPTPTASTTPTGTPSPTPTATSTAMPVSTSLEASADRYWLPAGIRIFPIGTLVIGGLTPAPGPPPTPLPTATPDPEFGHGSDFILRNSEPCANLILCQNDGLVVMDFGLGGLPLSSGSALQQATLTLQLLSGEPEGLQIEVGRATEAWSEDDSRRPACDFAGAVIANVGVFIGQYDWNVTELVRTLLDNPSENHGLCLRLVGTGERIFNSREGPSDLRPRLDIVYQP
jgi:serine/threonine protein kinase